MGIDGLQGPHEYDPEEEPDEMIFFRSQAKRAMGRYAHDLTPSLYMVILLV
jgi:hypothetical protein